MNGGGNPPKSKFPDASQGPTLYGGLCKERSPRPVVSTWFRMGMYQIFNEKAWY